MNSTQGLLNLPTVRKLRLIGEQQFERLGPPTLLAKAITKCDDVAGLGRIKFTSHANIAFPGPPITAAGVLLRTQMQVLRFVAPLLEG